MLKATMPYIIICLLSAVVFLAIIVLFAALTPLGYWHDEYDAFAALRNMSFVAWNVGIGKWIPRPVSNFMIGIYGLAVLNTHRQFVTSALLSLWLLLFGCICLAPVLCFRKYGWRDKAPLLGLGLSLMSMFLLGHPISEAFYWPMAAFAYLPTLSGIGVLLWAVCAGATETKGGRVVCAAAMLFAAASSEMGAMFVCVFTSLAIAAILFGPRQDRQTGRAKTPWIWLFVPLAAALWVVFMVAVGRGQDASEGLGVGDALIRHHAAPSILAAFPAAVRELMFPESGPLREFLAKGIFFAGCYLILSNVRSGLGKRAIGYYLIDLVLACAATFFLTIVAGFYQFGLDCCEHHATVRQCLIFISLMAGAGAIATFRTGTKGRNDRELFVALGCLILAAAILLYNAIPRLAFDYTNFDIIKNTRISNWESGLQAGDSMTYTDAPYGQIVGGWTGMSGTYTRSNASSAQLGMLKFFQKETVTYTSLAPRSMSLSDAYFARPADFSKFEDANSTGRLPAVPATLCNIEMMNDLPISNANNVKRSSLAQISGWSLMQGPDPLAQSVFLSVKNTSGDYLAPVIYGTQRPDVTAHFSLGPSLNGSGFHVAADFSEIPPGAYELSVLSVRGAVRQTCGDVHIMVVN